MKKIIRMLDALLEKSKYGDNISYKELEKLKEEILKWKKN